MRPISLSNVEVTPHGFPYDRRFMLFKVMEGDGKRKLRRMTVTNTTEMVLYHPRIDLPTNQNDGNGTITVEYCPPGGKSKEITMPLKPDVSTLETVDTALHESPAKAYIMGDKYNSWFSSNFGYPVVLVYLGPHLRALRGNLSPNAATKGSKKTWLSSVTENLPGWLSADVGHEEGITFADCAPYLVVTEESLHDVSARLPKGVGMDITKFRPNIVVSGATDCYEEDFWGGLKIIANANEDTENNEMELILTNNCARCSSLNIDYATGKIATDETGTVLKKLMKDRRVDTGQKWSPVFGRYSFLKADGLPNRRISIGNEVMVCKRNKERTALGDCMPAA
ncbi:MAG: hypothetical protein Q9191_004986 [Dirinaria sp. TL-2023a]